jgi:tetratricopeptide (TPR) repeat protein
MLFLSRLTCALAVCFLPFLAFAQAPAVAPDHVAQTLAPASFANESAVVEDLDTKARFENDGQATIITTVRAKVQSEAAVQQSGLIVLPYASAIENLDVKYVRVRKPDGTVIETPLDSVQDLTSEVARSAPMYTDQHEKHVAVRGLSVGDILEYSSVLTIVHPAAPGQFWFSLNFVKALITIHENAAIDVPRQRPVKILSPNYAPVVTETGDRRMYRFETSHLTMDPAPDRWEAALKGTPLPDVQISSFANWDEVAAWYGSLQHGPALPTPEVRAKALELTRNGKDDTEKIHSIYDYVSTNFRYIGISLGQGRFAPHPAAEVMANQFGDCKDKHTLMAALLQSVGIASYPALISSGFKTDADIPTPSTFDHVITVIPRGDSFQWLDTTPGVAPYGFLWQQLRDKLALVVLGDGHSKLIKTPAETPTPSFMRFTMTATLDSTGTMEGQARAEMRGDHEVGLRLAFQNTPKNKWKDLMQSISAAMGFSGTVDEVAARAPEDTTSPFWITYSYKRPDYADWTNHHTVLPFPGFELTELSAEELKSPAAIPLVVGDFTFEARLTLPAGYFAVPSPSLKEKRDFADYESSYAMESGTLSGSRHLHLSALKVPAGQRSEYESFYKAIENEANQWIIVTTLPTGPGLKLSRNPEAQRLFAEGLESYQLGAPWAAGKSLEAAIKLDPDWADAWLLLAKTRIMNSNFDSAKVAFRKVFSLDPTNLQARMEFAKALTDHYDFLAAIVAWQDLLKLDPTNTNAPIALAELLIEARRFAEARPMAEKAVELDEKNGSYRVTLGNVYVHLGKDEQASAEFQKAVELSPGFDTLNNIGYLLAESDRLLPEAQRYAELAVQQAEAGTFNFQAGSFSRESASTTGSVLANWDTLGWVYFHQKNYPDAERYLAAAWSFAPDPTMGEHLAQVYEKEGKKALALRTYALALSALPVNGSPELRQRLFSHLLPAMRRLRWPKPRWKIGRG